MKMMGKHLFALATGALFALGVACPHRVCAQDIPADGATRTGWLEGTVLDEQGDPVQGVNSLQAPHIRGTRRGGGTFDVTSDAGMGGLYSVRNLQPGVYDLTIPSVRVVTNQGDASYCPQRIFGVTVKPGVRTVLPITLKEGDALEDIGQPETTEQGLLVSQELARLQKEIDGLKAQIKALAPSDKPPTAAGAAAP